METKKIIKIPLDNIEKVWIDEENGYLVLEKNENHYVFHQGEDGFYSIGAHHNKISYGNGETMVSSEFGQPFLIYPCLGNLEGAFTNLKNPHHYLANSHILIKRKE